MQDILSFLIKIIKKGKYSKSTNEFLINCPFCNHYKPKLSINLKNHMWQCFVCGQASKKGLYFLIKKIGNKKDVQEYLNKYNLKKIKINRHKEQNNFQLFLPNEFIPLISCRNSKIAGKKEWEYLKKRGITKEDILKFKIGTAFDGQYKNRIILPSFNDKGSLNIFTSRLLNTEKGKNKYLSPYVPRDYKNNIIINELNIDWSKPIVLVEGYFDMLKSTRNTIPLFGSTLNKESKLFEKIILNNVAVYLALDSDADKKKLQIAKTLLSNDVEVYDINIKPFKDVGCMNKEEFINAYKNANILNHNNILKNKIKTFI